MLYLHLMLWTALRELPETLVFCAVLTELFISNEYFLVSASKKARVHTPDDLDLFNRNYEVALAYFFYFF